MPRRTLSPRMSSTVMVMSSPMMMLSSRCRDRTNMVWTPFVRGAGEADRRGAWGFSPPPHTRPARSARSGTAARRGVDQAGAGQLGEHLLRERDGPVQPAGQAGGRRGPLAEGGQDAGTVAGTDTLGVGHWSARPPFEPIMTRFIERMPAPKPPSWSSSHVCSQNASVMEHPGSRIRNVRVPSASWRTSSMAGSRFQDDGQWVAFHRLSLPCRSVSRRGRH